MSAILFAFCQLLCRSSAVVNEIHISLNLVEMKRMHNMERTQAVDDTQNTNMRKQTHVLMFSYWD